jgi:hypothetical protein
MTEIADESNPALFAHGTRKDWGFGVLAGERDGKRSYLFESGEERLMGSGALDMMRRVSPLDREQYAIYARLSALVARRHGRAEPSKAHGASLLEQLEVLRGAFAGGFQDEAWKPEARAGRVRGERLDAARKLLSGNALDAQLKAQQFDAMWSAAAKALSSSEWVPNDQLTPRASGEELRQLTGALRELLHGSGPLEQRIDRFVAAFDIAFRIQARWETVTGLLSLVSPSEHVLVDLASFRKQLKALGAKGTLPAHPTGAAYLRCINAARAVYSKLAENGASPEDLLDVHDFIRFTLKPKPPVRRPAAAKPKKAAKKKAEAAAEDESEAAEESSED